MSERALARELIRKGKFKEATHILDQMLAKDSQDAGCWHLKGIAALKMRSYEAAKGHLVRANSIEDKPEYRKAKGMVHFELLELEEAVGEFLCASGETDAQSHLYAALAFMLMDDPRAADHLKEALRLDPAGSRRALEGFYEGFIAKDPRVGQMQKNRMRDLIGDLSSRKNAISSRAAPSSR